MKPHQKLLLNLPLGRKLKKRLPLKVIFFISQLQEENKKLVQELEQFRSAKIPDSAQFRINQLQTENSKLKQKLSSLVQPTHQKI
ncbi:hypothetical protein [Gloeothece verrucosa]|uniref:Uncharacterized protein n=1 Tax=Gloeothece verrucosa (strain PCC 7822) TaxID=497965 RepID=E0UEN6_GLOV7|nr:hypothetical protein [Gloeothece verrucosa]ADN16604.1 hypothetical protein Cyan7822_4699 [Gloeothece verrucosa PCC 7822]